MSVARFDAFLEVEQVEVVAGFAVELVELLEVELLQQAVVALQADQVVEAAGIGQRLLERQHGGAVLNLADLLGKLLGVFGIEAEQDVLDCFDFLRDLFGGFEQVGVVLHARRPVRHCSSSK